MSRSVWKGPYFKNLIIKGDSARKVNPGSAAPQFDFLASSKFVGGTPLFVAKPRGSASGRQRSKSSGPIYPLTPVITAQSFSVLPVSRNSVVLPSFIGKKVAIHNGREWNELEISLEHVGHKFGEFSITRRPGLHRASR